MFEATIQFEPVSLKRHRHRLQGGTYDPSKKEKDEFVKTIGNLMPEEKMTNQLSVNCSFIVKDLKTITKLVKNQMNLKKAHPNTIQIQKI